MKKSIAQGMLVEEVLQEVLESFQINLSGGNVFLKRANSLAILKNKGTFKEQEVYDYETLELKVGPKKPALVNSPTHIENHGRLNKRPVN